MERSVSITEVLTEIIANERCRVDGRPLYVVLCSEGSRVPLQPKRDAEGTTDTTLRASMTHRSTATTTEG